MVVGEGRWSPESVGGPRRLIASMSTMYDFVARQIFLIPSASARAFVTRFPFVFFRARVPWVGCTPLDWSGDRVEAHSAIKSAGSHLVRATTISPYRSRNCCRVSSFCLLRKL